jgi:hypothetical protein
MISRARQFRDIASECRSIAALSKDCEIRDQLLVVAERFEDLARCHESLEQPTLDCPNVEAPRERPKDGRPGTKRTRNQS